MFAPPVVNSRRNKTNRIRPLRPLLAPNTASPAPTQWMASRRTVLCGALAAALARNAYRENGGAIPAAAPALAARVLATARALESVRLDDLFEGRFHYPKP